MDAVQEFRLGDGRNLILRKAVRADAAAIIENMRQIAGETDFLTFGAGEFNIPPAREEDLIEQFLQADNRLFLIAEVDGRIVGNIVFSGGSRPRVRHVGEFGVSLSRDCWGLGIGARMLRYLLDWAKAGGVIRKINLRVREDNRRAIGLYEKMGFKREGIRTRDMLVEGRFHGSISMGIEID
ncbi:MAG: GNAT family N-acetyltransferase [Firmicutes bacterium]|nr:GNAT family N-acetyltransferase [Bacillota bacterium]